MSELQDKYTTNSPNGPTLTQIANHVKESASQDKKRNCAPLSHEQIMTNLLTQIQKIDFRERAEIDPDNEDAKLRKAHYLILTAEEVLALARRNEWNLCEREGIFYAYNGAYWKAIPSADLKRFLNQAAEKMGVDKFNARHFEFSDSLLKQFTETAYLPAPKPDHSTVKINLQNGTFEFRPDSQQLRAPDANDFLTHQLPFAYDPEAKTPQLERFLNRVLPDVSSQQVLAEYIGYLFTSSIKLEKCLLLHGSGANGKSVFFEIITALLGEENVTHYSLQSLTTGNAYCRAHLATKLVNYASEIHGKLEADTFKQLASNEPIEARLPYGQPFSMRHYAKLIFNCNELPTDVEHTNAYFRRFLIVPFLQVIPESEQDKTLSAKIIKSELPGVFNWVLSGLRRLLANEKLTDCEAARQQLETYKIQSDSVRLFLDEQEYKPDPENFTFLKDLYREYKVYCSEDGYRPVNNKNFQKRLNTNGVHTARKNVGFVAYTIKHDTF